MATIGTQSLSQLVKINPQSVGVGDFRKTLFDESSVEVLKSRFYPLSPQVDALRVVAESAISGGSVLLMGAEGTGKSCLMLMLGKLLSLPYPSQELSSLSSNISDVSVVRSLLALRTGGRRWLVVVPEFAQNEAFYVALRRALNGALFVQGAEDFVPKTASVVEEYAETCDYLQKSGRYDGIIILADAFDKIFDQVVAKEPSEHDSQVKEFVDYCSKSRFPVLFVGTVDRDMSHFSILEETAMIEIFGKVQPVSLLGKVGEWEELVGKVIVSHPQDEAWQTITGYKDFRAVTESTARSGLYQGCSDKWLNDVILQGAYPLHPSALFALPRVALHLAAKGKTAFNFFFDAAPGGITYFLRNFAVVQPNGRLHLYTADSLYTYFEKVINSDPANKDYVEALQKAVMAAGDIPQSRRILRMVLIFQMVGFERLRTRAEDLIWALHIDERATRIAKHSLDLLVQKKALIYVEATGEYLLPVERKKVTFEDALQRISNRVRSQVDVRGELQKALRYSRFNARALNNTYGTDRCAFAKAFLVRDLRDISVFLGSVEEVTEQLRPYRGDIMVAFVVPESNEELTAIKADIEAGKYNSKRLIMALPAKASTFSKDAVHKFALQRLLVSEQPFSDPDSDENKLAAAALAEASLRINKSLSSLLEPHELTLYYLGQGQPCNTEAGLEDFIENKVSALVGTPPVLTEPSLAYLRDAGHARRLRQVAINYLLACQGELGLREDSQAIARILRAGLLDTEVLSQVSDTGIWHSFDLNEHMPNTGIGAAFCFLKESIIGAAGATRRICARSVVMPLLEVPYSLTPATIELLLAVLVWKWPKALVLSKNNKRAEAECNDKLLVPAEASAETLFELVGNSADWAISFCDAEPSACRFLNGVMELVGEEHRVETDSLWTGATGSLFSFFRALPQLAKISGICATQSLEPNELVLVSQVTQVISNNLDNPDLRGFSERLLPQALGAPADFSWEAESDRLLEGLKVVRKALAAVLGERETSLCSGLKEIMAPHSGVEELSWVGRVAEWLKSVNLSGDSTQWRLELSALKVAVESGEEEVKALHGFIANLSYPALPDWTCDYSSELLERVRTMREAMEWNLYSKGYTVPNRIDGSVKVLGSVIARAGLSSGELQEFLERELTYVAWPEYLTANLVTEDEPESTSAAEVAAASREFISHADDWLEVEEDTEAQLGDETVGEIDALELDVSDSSSVHADTTEVNHSAVLDSSLDDILVSDEAPVHDEPSEVEATVIDEAPSLLNVLSGGKGEEVEAQMEAEHKAVDSCPEREEERPDSAAMISDELLQWL